MPLERKPVRGDIIQCPTDDQLPVWIDWGVVNHLDGNLCYARTQLDKIDMFIWKHPDCLNQWFRIKPRPERPGGMLVSYDAATSIDMLQKSEADLMPEFLKPKEDGR